MHLLLISGSTRAASTNTAVLRTAQTLADFPTTLYDELSALPAFNPDDDREPLHPAVARLREELEKADAVLFCTPEYAGALPGEFQEPARLERRRDRDGRQAGGVDQRLLGGRANWRS
jgi:chromate reductase